MAKKILQLLFTSLVLLISACANQQVTEKNAQAAHYNATLGISYFQQGQPDRAREKLLLALQQDPQSSEVLDAMAYFLEFTGEPQKAQVYYIRALNATPHSGSAQNYYGAYLCRTNQYAKGIEYFVQAAQSETYLHPAQAYANAGLCALKIPNPKAAQQYLLMAYAKNPSQKNVLFALAQLDFNAGQYHEAQQYLQQLAALENPLSPPAAHLKLQLTVQLSSTTTQSNNTYDKAS